MKYIFILLFLISCNGEVKEKPEEKVNIQRLVGILQNAELDQEILVGGGFKITGHFDYKIKNRGIEEECKGSIFRKEFPESFFYFYVDCRGNYMFNLLRKKI